MNKNEKRIVKILREIIQNIKDGSISIESVEIEHDVEKALIPGTTILSSEYTGNHILTVRWFDSKNRCGQ
jgi:hypothetical protein